MSVNKRVAAFRKRNPGYDARRMAERRAQAKALTAARVAAEQQALAEAVAALVAPVKPVLMLPAPVQDPAMEALNAMVAKLKSGSAAESVMIPAIRSIAA